MKTMNVLTEVIEESIAVKRAVLTECGPQIEQIAEALAAALRADRKILICGNGGSASDAQHVAGEFIGRFLKNRRPLPAIALTADTAILTCVSNDYSFADVFSRQAEALAAPGDVLVGITTSGNSPNVLNAVDAARAKGALTIGFTGQTGGKLKESTDLCFCAPSAVTARIQEAHITVWHAICQVIESDLCS